MKRDYIYSFRIGLELEDLAKKLGFETVSDFVRWAILDFIRNNNDIEEKYKILINIDLLYSYFRKLMRLIHTKKLLEKLSMNLDVDDDDIKTVIDIVKMKIRLEDEYKKFLISEIKELKIRMEMINNEDKHD